MKNSFMTVGELKRIVAELHDDDKVFICQLRKRATGTIINHSYGRYVFDEHGNRKDVGGYLDLIVEDVRL